MSELLSIVGLSAKVAGKSVLNQVNLSLPPAQIMAVYGANGGGKSSLAQVLLGNPDYEVSGGEITFIGSDLLKLSVEARAKAGLYIAWQNPVTIPGVSVFALCKTAYEAQGGKITSLSEFKRRLEELATEVGLTASHISRFVNDGFSGGEKKRLELLQILLLKPKIVVLDEIDSGLDKNGRELIVEVIKKLKEMGSSLIIISHYEQLIEKLNAELVMEMKNGQLLPRIS
ncbi:MAG: Fe-S cluster assembly ATPase SufC [Candidatus Moraniibacteriota bacterium]|nr:MAG: Fe-S cluster assembly ATPase SufC [Candidatus Moranbacteria bacterium]